MHSLPKHKILFNERVTLRTELHVAALDVADESIAERRREIYNSRFKPPVQTVPVVELNEAALVAGKASLEVVARYVHFRHYCVLRAETTKTHHYSEDGLLYDLLFTARQNGLYAWYLQAKPQPKIAELLYMAAGDDKYTKADRRILSKMIAASVTTWTEMCRAANLDAVRQTARRILKSDELAWGIEITNWAPYVEHCLFHDKQSRLYNVQQKQQQIRIVPVNPDDEAQYKWEAMFLAYVKANPRPTDAAISNASAASTMLYPPYHNHFLDRTCLTLAAVDVGDASHAKLAGYVTCSLRAVKAGETRKFTQKELSRFFRQLLERANGLSDRTDCGYDILSIDGLHVDVHNQSASLSFTLLQYVVEFVRQAHRHLGLSLLVCESAAVQTKVGLKKLGFSHFNVLRAFDWLLMAFRDYANKLQPKKGYESFKTPDKLLVLTKAGLLGLFGEFRDTYVSRPEFYKSTGYAKALQKIGVLGDRLGQMAKHHDEKDKAFVVSVYKWNNDFAGMRKQLAQPEIDTYNARVGRALGSNDTEDTLFFINKQKSDEEIFSASAPLSPAKVAKQKAEDVFDNRAVPRSVPRIRLVQRKQPELFDEEPDDADMALYDEWAALEEPGLPPLPLDDRLPTEFVHYVEEAKREDRSLLALRKYLEGLVAAFNRKLGTSGYTLRPIEIALH